MTDYTLDEERITEIVEGMFSHISWQEGSPPDLDSFAAAVRGDAVLVPAARPVVLTDIASFTGRMAALHAGGAIKTFDERAGRTQVWVFGNLAVAIGGFVLNADGSESRGANGFLLVRDGSGADWQIAAMAWDNETAEHRLSEGLV